MYLEHDQMRSWVQADEPTGCFMSQKMGFPLIRLGALCALEHVHNMRWFTSEEVSPRPRPRGPGAWLWDDKSYSGSVPSPKHLRHTGVLPLSY